MREKEYNELIKDEFFGCCLKQHNASKNFMISKDFYKDRTAAKLSDEKAEFLFLPEEGAKVYSVCEDILDEINTYQLLCDRCLVSLLDRR